MSNGSRLLARIRKWLRRDRPLANDEGGPARALGTQELQTPDESAALTDEERAALTLHIHDEQDTDDAPVVDTTYDDDVEVKVVGRVTPDEADRCGPDGPHDATNLLIRQQTREQRLVDGVQELTDLLATIRTGIQSQEDRQQEMLDRFEGLPEFLAQVPETGKAQLALLKTLQQEVSRAGHTNADLASHLKQLPSLLQPVPQMVESQNTLLQQVADRLSSQTRHGQEVVTSLEAMRFCLGQVAATSERQVSCLASMEMAHQRNMEALADSLHDQGRRMAALLVTTLGIVAVALAGLLFLASVVSRAGLLGN